MLKLIRKIKFDYSILKNIFSLANKKIKFIFYSENKFYQKYSSPIIELLAKKYPKQIYYVSSDLNDKIENTNVKNLFIGDGLLMKVFFAIIKAEYFFLTVTDLDNHYLKKIDSSNRFLPDHIKSEKRWIIRGKCSKN